jgi:anaerobic magnesium-protoporphyrin IX monomethyl ester cyclase
MPVNVLLTYPSDGLRLFTSMIPIGITSIGTVLEQNGYSVKIIDFNHYSRDFRRDLLDLRPDIIGIGGTTPTRNGSFLTARIAKSIFPNVPVVYGGVHATFTPENTLSHVPQIDFLICGEGELSFLSLCNKLLRGYSTGFDQISGLCYRHEGMVKCNPAERIDNLAALPIPNRKLLPFDYRVRMEFLDSDGDFIITSRGCPAGCNFCAASKMFPGGVRLRNIDQVGTEIEQILSNKKISGLKIFDSTFTADRNHVLSFCEMIKRFCLKWECEVRADTVDEDLLSEMKNAGCYYINIGMETSNQTLLKKIGKGINSGQVLSALDSCRKNGIKSKVFFTFGHAGQKFDDCLKDLAFIENNKSRIDFFAVTVGMRIFPGTRLEKNALKTGALRRDFSWHKKVKSFKNLLVLEPGDIPVLFQKELDAHHLFIIIIRLFFKKSLCTPQFLFDMFIANVLSFFLFLYKQCKYTCHVINRNFFLQLKSEKTEVFKNERAVKN